MINKIKRVNIENNMYHLNNKIILFIYYYSFALLILNLFKEWGEVVEQSMI
jgi:hypothetical protein